MISLYKHTIKTILLLLIIIFISPEIIAKITTSVTDGNWNNNDTWNNGKPVTDDTVFVMHNVNFNANFDLGAGIITINPAGILAGNKTMNIWNSSGKIYVYGTFGPKILNVSGSIDNYGTSAITSNLMIAESAIVINRENASFSAKNVDCEGSFYNYGTMTISLKIDSFYGNSRLENYGSITVGSNFLFYGNSDFYNYGNFNLTGNMIFEFEGDSLVNHGYMNIYNFDSDGTIINSDTLIIRNKVEDIYGGKFVNETEAYINVDNKFNLSGYAELQNNGVMVIAGDLNNWGNNLFDNNGQISVGGTFENCEYIRNNGAIYLTGSNDFENYGILYATVCGHIDVGNNIFKNWGEVSGPTNICGTLFGDGSYGPEVTYFCYNPCIPAEYTWTANAGTNEWEEPGNWNEGSIPDSDANANIPTNPEGGQIFPLISSEASVNTLTIDSSASLTIGQEHQITVCSDWTNNGNAEIGEGTVIMDGNSLQTISGNNRFNNLTMNNPNGVSLIGEMEISGILLLTQGILTTNDNLTLVSDENSTGLVSATGSGSISGSATMQRYLSFGKGYKYFSSPFIDSDVDEFEDDMNLITGYPYIGGDTTNTVSPFPTFFKYDETYNSQTFSIGWDSPGSTLVPLLGYAVNFGNDPAPNTVDVSGYFNSGALEINVTNTSSGKSSVDGWNLVGNPYPSPIDWDSEVGWTKENIENAIYFYEATSEYRGNYYSYVNGIGTGNASNIIASMQGFFIKTTSNGTLGMTDDVRVDITNPTFFKSYKNSNEYPLIRLSASLNTNDSKTDETVICFYYEATTNFDKMLDAHKLLSFDTNIPNIYSISSGKSFSINCLPEIDNRFYEINLGFVTGSPGEYKIEATEINNFPSDLNVFIKDNINNSTHDLKLSPYYFEIQQEGTTNRFNLLITKSSLDINENPLNRNFAYSFGNTLVVTFENPVEESAALTIYNILGTKVAPDRSVRKGINYFNINLPGGYYILKLAHNENINVQKIFLK